MTGLTDQRYTTTRLMAWRDQLKHRRWLRYGLIWLFFLSTGWLLVQPGLHVQFFGDDLHLVRSYTENELRNVWQGAWDPDGLSTVGYRPLTTLFNHVRYSILGENVVAHRLLLMALFAIYLTLMVALARLLFRVPYLAALLGSLITQFHLDSTYHDFWISDGIHLVVGLAVLGAILCLLHAMRTEHWRWLLLSLFGVAVALLTREDSLILYPLLVYFAMIFAQGQRNWRRAWLKPLMGYVIALVGMGAFFWWIRSTYVSQALAVQFAPSNFVWTLRQTSQNMGNITNLLVWWPDYVTAIVLWLICLGFVAAVFLFVLPRSIRGQAWAWLIALLISALPGLTLPRTNLLLFAVTFWGLFLATVLVEFARRSRGQRWLL